MLPPGGDAEDPQKAAQLALLDELMKFAQGEQAKGLKAKFSAPETPPADPALADDAGGLGGLDALEDAGDELPSESEPIPGVEEPVPEDVPAIEGAEGGDLLADLLNDPEALEALLGGAQ